MVIIDVFAKIRGQSAPGASAYDADYAAVGRVKKVADAYGVAVVLVHHVRKAGSDDFLEAVSGTNGLAGAADATLVLRRPRGAADGVLHVTGRDVDESEYPLAFEPAAGAWRMLDGPADDHALGDTRATILRWLRGQDATTPKGIAGAIGIGIDNTATEYAIELKLLPGNPVPALKWKPPRSTHTIDRRSVANPVQVRTLLDAVRGQQRSRPRLVAFFGCLYYAALRPEEAVALAKQNLALPPVGWGELHLERPSHTPARNGPTAGRTATGANSSNAR